MVEWDSLKDEGKMLEMAQAWLILPPIGWDLPEPEATEPVPGELQVISFVPFHLARLGVPAHPFV